MINLLRTFLPLLLSTGAALALTAVVPDYFNLGGFHSGNAPWEAFFSTFGLLYAIIAGFLLVTVLGRHSDLSSVFESELNAVEDIRDFLVYLDGPQEEAIAGVKQKLLTYVRSVSEKEWPMMLKGGKMNSDTTPELYDVMRAVDKIKVTNESDRVSLRCIMEKVSDLTSLRTKRIALSNQHLPTRLKWLTVLMSLILVASMILVGGKNMYLHMAMVGSVSISVHLLYPIIADLDRPFAGVWNVDKAPLVEVQRDFEKEISA